MSLGKSKTMFMQIFWGVEVVYYGIVQVETCYLIIIIVIAIIIIVIVIIIIIKIFKQGGHFTIKCSSVGPCINKVY